MKKLIMMVMAPAKLQAPAGVMFLSAGLLVCRLILAPSTAWSADAGRLTFHIGDTNSLAGKSGMSQTFAGRPEVQAYIQELARSTNHFSADELERVFSTARFSQDVIDRMGRATNNRTCFQYEAPLLTQSRIDGGVAFMRTNAPALARAKQRYGVPPEIVTAMICVESDYGRAPLDFKAVESLATLAFGYPPRSAYFRKELTQFLLLCREEKWDPLQIPSSRDGGLGLAQFMPTSYRRIAIDFDGDGHRNLLTNPTDAIGSIANYLNLDRWHKTNAIIAVRAVATGTNYQR